jgi:FG-GAP repeat
MGLSRKPIRGRVAAALGAVLIAPSLVGVAAETHANAVAPTTQQAEVSSDDGAGDDGFGAAVAVDGSTMVVGAPGHQVGQVADAGAVYVFSDSSGTWTQIAELTAGTDAVGVGQSVAVSGNTIVAGAPREGINIGAIYEWTMPAGGWKTTSTPTARLTTSDAAANDSLGSVVALSGTTIVSSAYHGGPGEAYGWTMPSAGWKSTSTQSFTLTIAGQTANTVLGAVAISGSTIAVGAGPQFSTIKGAIFLFTKVAGTWQQTAKLTTTESSTAEDNGFPYSLAMSGDTVVAGAISDSAAGTVGAGAVYEYTKPPGGWIDAAQTARLTASDAAAGDKLGVSVAIDGDNVVAGPQYHPVGSSQFAGGVWEWTKPSSGDWQDATETDEFQGTPGSAPFRLGNSVAISGGTVVGGAPDTTVGANSFQGAAYVFGKVESLSISSLTLDPPHPTIADGSITASLTIRNDFAKTVTNVVPSLVSTDPSTLSVDGGAIPASTTTLAAGASTTFTYQLTPLQAQTVSLEPSATAIDPSADKTTAPAVPPRVIDLSAGDVTVALTTSPQAPAVGQQVTETATITNKTGATLTNLSATLTGAPTDSLTVGDPSPASVASLDPHGSTSISWPITASDAQTYKLEAAVDLTDPTSGEETDIGRQALAVGGSVITVNSTDDAAETSDALANQICDSDQSTPGNQCTLRAAITLADTMTNEPTIAFDIPGGGVPDIAPASALPAATASMTIDGSTESGGWVQLSGAAAGTGDGLDITAGASTIRGLVIDGWANGDGINITSGLSTVVVGDRIGTDVTGASAVPNSIGIGADGATVTIGGMDGTTSGTCTGDCDLISGNTISGINSGAASPAALTVQGDYIGTDVTGETAIPNPYGINVVSGAALGTLTVGGPSTAPGVAPGNVISGNTNGSVQSGSPMTVMGNLIGLDAQGTTSLQAVPVDDSSQLVGLIAATQATATIGGTEPSDENVISGFTIGVKSVGPVTVDHDRIGTDVSGMHAVPNWYGVYGAGDGTTKTAVTDSVISGNKGGGVNHVQSVTGSLIGTNAAGSAAVANDQGVVDTAQIGGVRSGESTACTGPCNVISGNLHNALVEPVNRAAIVAGNYIGTDQTGTSAIPNGAQLSPTQGAGVVASIEHESTIGGPSDAVSAGRCDRSCNLISGNVGTAVSTSGSVEGNVIGLSSTGAALGNSGIAVLTRAGVTEPPVVGGDGDTGNLIDDNQGPAVTLLTLDKIPTIEGNSMAGNAYGILESAGGSGTQNYSVPPVMTGAAVTASGLSVTGSVSNIAHNNTTSARVDLYLASSCTKSKEQGQIPLGHTSATLLTGGDWTFTGTAPASSNPYLIATATESDHTSIFSACTTVSHATTVTPQPGQADTATAPGFTDGESVTVELHSTPVDLTTVRASSSGVATAKVTIPKSISAGPHELILTGATSHHVDVIPITVTPKPQAGLLHLVAPKTFYAKKVKHSAKVPIAGRGGIPKKGARHALVLIESATKATVDGHRVAARTSSLQVLPVSAATIKASKPGKVTLVALGWYAAAKSTAGDVLRAVKPSHLTKSGALTAGGHGLPFVPTLDGVVLSVTSKSGKTTVGGIAVPASSDPATVVCRVINGAVAVHLAKHASVTVTGWYGTPAAAAGGQTTG